MGIKETFERASLWMVGKMQRMAVLMGIAMGLFLLGMYLHIQGHFISAYLMWSNGFFVWILFFGSLRERIRNLLPFLLINLYLMTAFILRDFVTPLWIMSLLPFISYVLRVKRRIVHTLMLIFAVSYLMLDLFFGLSIALPIRLGLIVAIYALYIPIRIQAILWQRESIRTS